MAQILNLNVGLLGTQTAVIDESDTYTLNLSVALGATLNVNVVGEGTHAVIAGVNANITLASVTNYNVGEGATLQFDDLASLSVSALAATNFTIADNGTLILNDFLGVNVLGSRTLAFTGDTGKLVLGAGLDLNLLSSVEIEGFGYGKEIDVSQLANSIEYSSLTGTLYLFNDGLLVGTVPLERGLDESMFRLTPLPDGGTAITYACFLRGTRIATPEGEVAIEALRIGDKVKTLAGIREVKWIGRRTLKRDEIPAEDLIRAQPVRIRAGAFAEGVPSRDLIVSPGHCMFIDGALIPAMMLVNGKTVVQEWEMESYEYFHLELDVYDIIIAEGTASESYIDKGNRQMFVQPGIVTILPSRRGSRGALEKIRTVRGPVVEAVRKKLFARAAELGYRMTRNPDLAFIMAGRSLPVTASEDGKTFTVALPDISGDLTIASRTGIVREFMTGASRDLRKVGVAVTGLALVRGQGVEELSLEHEALAEGFHAVQDFRGLKSRWTDGAGFIPASLLRGASALQVTIASTPRYWREEASDKALTKVA